VRRGGRWSLLWDYQSSNYTILVVVSIKIIANFDHTSPSTLYHALSEKAGLVA
jgi:hypothetical protein